MQAKFTEQKEETDKFTIIMEGTFFSNWQKKQIKKLLRQWISVTPAIKLT